METFSVLLAICAGNSPVPGEFPTHRPARRSFDVFSDLRPNKRLSKQSWGWWCETPLHSLRRHSNVFIHDGWVITTFKAWIGDCIYVKRWNVNTHPCPNLKMGIAKSHGWVSTSHRERLVCTSMAPMHTLVANECVFRTPEFMTCVVDA